MRWQYGLTTVPSRRHTYLPLTLASLKRAGFDTPHLFVDGDCHGNIWYSDFGLPVTCRSQVVRTAGNWICSLLELYCLDSGAERYAIFQDDVAFYKNLKPYLERWYPDRGYLNLYTHGVNQRIAPRGGGWFESNGRGIGALALVFNNDAVVELFSSRHMAERPRDKHRGHKAIDGGIVESMKKAGYIEYCHSPSLCQHIGENSSMDNGPHRPSPSFRGEDFDALSLEHRPCPSVTLSRKRLPQ